MVAELVRETFDLDSRLSRTLGKLLFRPGELAVEFSRNRRASYVSPIRLYLFVSILFFFLLSITTDVVIAPVDKAEVTRELESVTETDVDHLLRQLDVEQRQKVAQILEKPETSLARLALLQLAKGVGDRSEELEAVEVYVFGRLVDAIYEPASLLDQLVDNLPVAIFIMLPVYALLLKIFYVGRHRYYVENLVFATHLHTFVFILFTLLLLLPDQPSVGFLGTATTWLATLLWLWLALYHYLALKRYFGDSHFATLLKFSGLMFVYAVLLLPAAFSLVTLVTVIMI